MNISPLSRRKLLGNAGSVVAAVSLSSLPALASLNETRVTENPALLALAPQIEAAEAQFWKAQERYKEAHRAGHKLWPRAPKAADGYQLDRSPHSMGGAIIEREIGGCCYGWKLEPEEKSRHIVTAAYLEETKPRAPQAIASWKRRLAKVKAYERACESAREVSGYPEAQKARDAAMEHLEALIVASVAERATTMQGILVKAKAMQAYRPLEK